MPKEPLKKALYSRLTAALYEPLLGLALSPMRATITTMLKDAGCRTVLDICCGPGGVSPFLHRAGIYAARLDLDANMVHVAKSSSAPQGRLVMADASKLPFAPASFDAAVISLALHEMPKAKAEAALDEALRVARLVLVADYRMAERNIDLPARYAATAVELLVGGEHWHNYKIFMSNGGLEGLVYRKKLKIMHRRNALVGAAACILVRKQEI